MVTIPKIKMNTNREKIKNCLELENLFIADNKEKISYKKEKKRTDNNEYFSEHNKLNLIDGNTNNYENRTYINRDEMEDEEEERDLTNLNWLTELRDQTIGFGNIALEEDLAIRNEAINFSTEQSKTFLSGGTFCELTKNNLAHKKRSFKTQHNFAEQQNAIKTSHHPKRPSAMERYEMFLNNIRRWVVKKYRIHIII